MSRIIGNDLKKVNHQIALVVKFASAVKALASTADDKGGGTVAGLDGGDSAESRNPDFILR